MKKLLNYFIILCLSTAALLSVDLTAIVIIGLCSALTCTGLEYALDKNEISMTFLLFHLILSLFLPEFSYFLPIISAGVFRASYRTRSKLFISLYLISYALLTYNIVFESNSMVFLTLFGSLFSMLLIYDNIKYDELKNKLIKTVDDSREITYLLKERNKNILEKQDYEIYAATLRERNRIAREIHDNVGHLLSRSILINGALKTVNKQEELRDSIDSLDETLLNAMTTVRESVHDLHNESVNLNENLESLISQFEFCPVEYKFDCSITVPSNVKYSFISIVKEAFSNIIKHSNASLVTLTVREHPGIYQLIIEDNGKVIDFNEHSDGIGLVNIRDRVIKLKGNLNIHTDSGFKIFITIPKENDYEKERQSI